MAGIEAQEFLSESGSWPEPTGISALQVSLAPSLGSEAEHPGADHVPPDRASQPSPFLLTGFLCVLHLARQGTNREKHIHSTVLELEALVFILYL